MAQAYKTHRKWRPSHGSGANQWQKGRPGLRLIVAVRQENKCRAQHQRQSCCAEGQNRLVAAPQTSQQGRARLGDDDICDPLPWVVGAPQLDRADERSRLAEDLRAEVRRLGGNPEDSGSFMGKTHQRWMDLKSAITGRDDKAIINEVERGEDYLKEKFETALNNADLPTESRSVVERVYQSVRQGHDQMRDLKHGMEA